MKKANRNLARLLLLPVFFGLGAASPEASEWSRYRGPNGSGISDAVGLPIEFGPAKHLVWKTKLPPGHSSPVLTEKRVFLTAFESEVLLTFCLDRETGEILWRRVAPRDRNEKVDRRNSPASPTPVTDGENVYVFFADYGMLSYDAAGNERWRLPLGPFDNAYGMGASPIIVDDKVILVCDQSTGSFMIAVGRDQGELKWHVDRSEYKTGHSTPTVYRPKGGDALLLVPGSFRLTAYTVATGEPVWWVTGLAFEMKATPVFNEDMVFINGTSGSEATIPPFEKVLPAYDADGDGLFSREETKDGKVKWFGLMDLDGSGLLDAEEWAYYQAAMATRGGMYGFRLGGGRGDITEDNLRWHYGKSVPQLPSSLLFEGVLHMLSDTGIVTSFEPATGKVINQSRIKGAIDNYRAAPVAADGKIFMVSESGKVVVMKPDGSLEVLAVNDLDDLCFATPAVADGRIYIRTASALYSFGLPNP